MLSANNLLRPQDGHPVTVPTQDMMLGCYWLTMERESENIEDDDEYEAAADAFDEWLDEQEFEEMIEE